MAYGPITLAYTAPGAQQTLFEAPEAATQTFKAGVVCKLSSGMVVIGDSADPWTGADVVYGVTAMPGQNLAVANTPEEGYSFATPPNQASAKTIPHGAPYKTGKTLIYKADGLNVFRIQLGSGQVFAQSLVIAATYYTLKYDAGTGYYYLDTADTAGNNAVAEIVSGVVGESSCLFRFKAAQRYFD